jgi:hypothetical protein
MADTDIQIEIDQIRAQLQADAARKASLPARVRQAAAEVHIAEATNLGSALLAAWQTRDQPADPGEQSRPRGFGPDRPSPRPQDLNAAVAVLRARVNPTDAPHRPPVEQQQAAMNLGTAIADAWIRRGPAPAVDPISKPRGFGPPK